MAVVSQDRFHCIHVAALTAEAYTSNLQNDFKLKWNFLFVSCVAKISQYFETASTCD